MGTLLLRGTSSTVSCTVSCLPACPVIMCLNPLWDRDSLKWTLAPRFDPSVKWVLEYFLGSKGGLCEIDHITNQVLIGLKIWGKHNVLNMSHCVERDVLAICLEFILYYIERVMLHISHFTYVHIKIK